MTTLSPDIKSVFFKTLSGDISTEEFEQWLYQTKELESQLTADDYYDLISFSFKQPAPKYELAKLLSKHIDLGDYETWRMYRLLDKVAQKQGNYPSSITEFYDLYCRGYDFMDNLAFGYGLSLDAPYCDGYYGSFDDLTKEDQMKLADGFYPEIIKEINQVRTWIESGQVVLTGKRNDIDHFEYIDNRPKAERQPTTYIKDTDNLNDKKWWEFWKK